MFSLILSWIFLSLVLLVTAFTHTWSMWLPWLGLIDLWPATTFWRRFYTWWLQAESWDKALAAVLWMVWLLHLVGVFVPETGFDALWYHLPIAQEMVQQRGLVYLPEYYQSLNPQLSDLVFAQGFAVAGMLGAKIVAFAFGLSTLAVSFALARKIMSQRWALVAMIVVSLIQPLAWQASSFYVDVAKAWWELAALWCVFEVVAQQKKLGRWLVLASLCMGASLATKLFSLALLPVFAMIVWWALSVTKPMRKTLLTAGAVVGAVLVAVPFYWWSYRFSGQWFVSGSLHLAKLDQIGGESSVYRYVWRRTLSLPSSWLVVSVQVRDYVSLLLLPGLPLLIAWHNHVWRNIYTRMLLIWSIGQWMVWWFVPPLSTRYALSGWITVVLLVLWALERAAMHNSTTKKITTALVVLAIAAALVPRLVVLKRNAVYLLGYQTQQDYLRQFIDGNIDHQLNKWYSLN